ncbi:MAG: UTRA domain-containing protein [Acidimicrobiales bacterium]
MRTPEFEQPLGGSTACSARSRPRAPSSAATCSRSRCAPTPTPRPGSAWTLAPSWSTSSGSAGPTGALAVDRIWLPHRAAGAVLDADFTHTALYDELQQRLGIVIDRFTERILPVLPDELDRVRLEVAADQPCFAIERLGLCHDHPIEWRHTLIRGDRFAFVASWAAGAGGAASGSNSSSFELAP